MEKKNIRPEDVVEENETMKGCDKSERELKGKMYVWNNNIISRMYNDHIC